MTVIKDPSFIKMEEASVFQKIYDWSKNIKTPPWLLDLLQFVQDNVLIPALKTIGEQAINDLRTLIVQAAKEDIPGKEKFSWVKNKWLETWSFDKLSDHALNIVIEHIVSECIEKGYIS